jgi:hypothetical protein
MNKRRIYLLNLTCVTDKEKDGLNKNSKETKKNEGGKGLNPTA